MRDVSTPPTSPISPASSESFDGSAESSESSTSTSHPATPASLPGHDPIDIDTEILDEGRGGDTQIGGLAGTRNLVVWQQRFASEQAYHKFQERWPHKSLVHERQFIERGFLPHNPNVKRQFDDNFGGKTLKASFRMPMSA